MSFWRNAHWQHRTADAIAAALQAVHARLLGQDAGGDVWTREVMSATGTLAATLCPEGVCAAYKRSAASQWYAGGEWLFDQVWLLQEVAPGPAEAARTTGIPLALECEWHGWKNVWDDFDKLLLARAGLRVFVFARDKATPDHWATVLADRAHAFADAAPDDAWLLCARSTDGFTCHRRITAP